MLTSARTASLRTSEPERQRVADFLRDCCAEGRLTADELDARLDSLWAGRTVADLERLVWDLPGGVAVLPSAHPAPPQGAARRSRAAATALAVLAAVAVVLAGVAVVVLPDVVVWLMLAMAVALLVTFVAFAITLAPAALAGLGLAWLVARLWRARPWAALSPPGDRRAPMR
jgi:VIT1/CCC1 family predicted Fe2+/Mn2+ transporter